MTMITNASDAMKRQVNFRAFLPVDNGQPAPGNGCRALDMEG